MFLEIQTETQKFSEPIVERISINQYNPLELIEKLQEMPNILIDSIKLFNN